MKKLYSGQIIIQISTIVDSQNDSIKERDAAHAAIDLDFLRELSNLAMAKGYSSNSAGFDLKVIREASENDVENLKEAVRKARAEEQVIRGEDTVCRIYF